MQPSSRAPPSAPFLPLFTYYTLFTSFWTLFFIFPLLFISEQQQWKQTTRLCGGTKNEGKKENIREKPATISSPSIASLHFTFHNFILFFSSSSSASPSSSSYFPFTTSYIFKENSPLQLLLYKTIYFSSSFLFFLILYILAYICTSFATFSLFFYL